MTETIKSGEQAIEHRVPKQAGAGKIFSKEFKGKECVVVEKGMGPLDRKVLRVKPGTYIMKKTVSRQETPKVISKDIHFQDFGAINTDVYQIENNYRMPPPVPLMRGNLTKTIKTIKSDKEDSTEYKTEAFRRLQTTGLFGNNQQIKEEEWEPESFHETSQIHYEELSSDESINDKSRLQLAKSFSIQEDIPRFSPSIIEEGMESQDDQTTFMKSNADGTPLLPKTQEEIDEQIDPQSPIKQTEQDDITVDIQLFPDSVDDGTKVSIPNVSTIKSPRESPVRESKSKVDDIKNKYINRVGKIQKYITQIKRNQLKLDQVDKKLKEDAQGKGDVSAIMNQIGGAKAIPTPIGQFTKTALIVTNAADEEDVLPPCDYDQPCTFRKYRLSESRNQQSRFGLSTERLNTERLKNIRRSQASGQTNKSNIYRQGQEDQFKASRFFELDKPYNALSTEAQLCDFIQNQKRANRYSKLTGLDHYSQDLEKYYRRVGKGKKDLVPLLQKVKETKRMFNQVETKLPALSNNETPAKLSEPEPSSKLSYKHRLKQQGENEQNIKSLASSTLLSPRDTWEVQYTPNRSFMKKETIMKALSVLNKDKANELRSQSQPRGRKKIHGVSVYQSAMMIKRPKFLSQEPSVIPIQEQNTGNALQKKSRRYVATSLNLKPSNEKSFTQVIVSPEAKDTQFGAWTQSSEQSQKSKFMPKNKKARYVS